MLQLWWHRFSFTELEYTIATWLCCGRVVPSFCCADVVKGVQDKALGSEAVWQRSFPTSPEAYQGTSPDIPGIHVLCVKQVLHWWRHLVLIQQSCLSSCLVYYGGCTSFLSLADVVVIWFPCVVVENRCVEYSLQSGSEWYKEQKWLMNWFFIWRNV